MRHDVDQRFPIKLKMFRLDMGMSQEEFASQLNISRSSLANYETGKRQPDAQTIRKIANLCKVKPEILSKTTSATGCVMNEKSATTPSFLKAIVHSGGNSLDISHLPVEYRIALTEYYDYIRSRFQKKK